jgi:type IV pilus assembly protein PilV
MTCPTTTATRQEIDSLQWCTALQGAAEIASGSKAGAMIGARGCVEQLPNNEYLITVAWQGLAPVSTPPSSVACGKNQYNGSNCTADRCRRVVTTIVRIATLT